MVAAAASQDAAAGLEVAVDLGGLRSADRGAAPRRLPRAA